MALVDQNYNSGASTLLIDSSANRNVSNTNGTNGISRLSQMQARFQQRQLQEKEQKLLRLYESQQQRAFQRVGRGSAGSSSVSSTTSSTTSSSSLGNGKVRQLFDERRTGGKAPTAGWDRSYPLEPLDTRRQTRGNGHHQPITRGASLERISSYAQPVKKAVARSKSQVRPGNLVNGGYADRNRHQEYSDPDEEYNYIQQDESDSPYSRDKNQNRYNNQDREIDQLFTQSRPSLYDNEEPLRDGETFDESQLFKKLSNVGGILLMKERTMNEDKYKTYNANSRKPAAAAAPAVTNRTTPMRRPVNGATTTPARTTMTTSTMAARPVARKAELSPSPPPPRSTAPPARKGVPPKSTATASPAPLRPSSNFNRTSPAPAPAASRSVGSRAVPPASPAKAVPSRPGPRVTAPPADNLAECKICGRRFATDRVEMHETICARTGQKKRKVFDPVKQRVKGTEAEAYVRQAAKQKAPVKEAAPKKSDWRRKHEEFINAIRAAKEVKAHLAAGGKLSDLPPPPPSENLDYVQCPHCSRRFNETAAERHIPRCADMQHNKPKPKASAAKGGVTPKKRY